VSAIVFIKMLGWAGGPTVEEEDKLHVFEICATMSKLGSIDGSPPFQTVAVGGAGVGF
jgi:hypothetical protein